MSQSQHVRHIQDFHHAGSLQPHWGYPGRVLPCTNDAGTCEYLDAVYWMHDVSMLYTFILWAVIGAVLLFWLLSRLTRLAVTVSTPPASETVTPDSTAARSGSLHRSGRALMTKARAWLLPESLTRIFGHVSRVQILALATIFAYLLVFSLVGIVYKTWITPIKGSTSHNTRTGLGGFADRVGALAYALTPLSIVLCSRESILTLITGLPHTSFVFLHIWLGRIIFIQSFLHTLGWTIIQARLYQPQPLKYRTFMSQQYIIFGVVAQLLITILYLGSIRAVVKRTGYEFFKLTHYISAALYLGACWAHWTPLACWMIAAIGLFFIDRGLRILRTLLIHSGHVNSGRLLGFKPATAIVKLFTDCEGRQVLRLEFEHEHKPWKVGQHFYLTFSDIAWWQAHPFTPASLPVEDKCQKHVYVVRVKSGITRKLAVLAEQAGGQTKTSVLLTGPYGVSIEPEMQKQNRNDQLPNLLAVAGGTGVSFALPAVLQRAKALASSTNEAKTGAPLAQLILVLRHISDVEWTLPELRQLCLAAQSQPNVSVKVLITQHPYNSTRNTPSPLPASACEKDQTQTTITTKSSSESITTVSTTSDSDLVTELKRRVLGTPLSTCSSMAWSNFSIQVFQAQRPALSSLVAAFTASVPVGRTRVSGSGPVSMGCDLRTAVAGQNDAARVLKGDERADVQLVWDDRG